MSTPTYGSSLPTSRAVLRQADHFSALTGQGPVRLARAVLRLRAAALAAASHGQALHPVLEELLARVALIRSSRRVGTSRLEGVAAAALPFCDAVRMVAERECEPYLSCRNLPAAGLLLHLARQVSPSGAVTHAAAGISGSTVDRGA